MISENHWRFKWYCKTSYSFIGSPLFRQILGKKSLVQCYKAEQMPFDQFFKATKEKNPENFSYSQDQIKIYNKKEKKF